MPYTLVTLVSQSHHFMLHSMLNSFIYYLFYIPVPVSLWLILHKHFTVLFHDCIYKLVNSVVTNEHLILTA